MRGLRRCGVGRRVDRRLEVGRFRPGGRLGVPTGHAGEQKKRTERDDPDRNGRGAEKAHSIPPVEQNDIFLQ